ncbi:MAG: amidohydrolase family protein, partial [Planctomycetes bacterium]|nr:amidohydrolase family protein [Planctomycetota bacterium]
KLGTFGGAFALGIETDTGTLALGKSADLAVVDLPTSDSTDPYALLFDPRSRIAATLSGGVQVA